MVPSITLTCMLSVFMTVFAIQLFRIVTSDTTKIADESTSDISVGQDEQQQIGTVEEIDAIPSSFSSTQCGDNPELLPVQIKKFSISPDPLVLPGVLKLKVSLKVKEEIQGPIKASLRMEKHYPEGWFTLPCNEQGYGSCDHPDICPFLHAIVPLCPKKVIDKGNNCTCPLQPGKYSFKTLKFPVMVGFQEGPFRLVAKLSSEEGRPLACLDTAIIFEKGQPLDTDQHHVHT